MDRLLEVQNLRISFQGTEGECQAVRGISFQMERGETTAIVGESGCGKSVTAKAILGLLHCPPGKILPGSDIRFEGRELLRFSKQEWQSFRGAECSMVFQDALTALNPSMQVGQQIMEGLLVHRKTSVREARLEAVRALEAVGISDAMHRAQQYPHQFSGGMRQRVMLAMALACTPKLLLADEPTTALDVTVQAQILDLLRQLRREHRTTVLLITHDLGIVAEIAQRILVMYAGLIVERGSREDLFYRTKHPYTKALLDAVPRLDQPLRRELLSIEGAPPDPLSPPRGCPFSPRCPYCMQVCLEEMPLETVFSPGHEASCWLHHPSAPATCFQTISPATPNGTTLSTASG